MQGCFPSSQNLQMNNGSVRKSRRVTALFAPDCTPPVLFRFLLRLFDVFFQITTFNNDYQSEIDNKKPVLSMLLQDVNLISKYNMHKLILIFRLSI